jgi:uncharacterized membrane protein
MDFVQLGEGYASAAEEPSARASLLFEPGWPDVRQGLGLILRGYFVMIAAILLVAAVFVFLFGLDPADRSKTSWQVRDIGLFLGLGALAVGSLYSYGCIVVGHWRCLMNAPERHGAKWLMFACITCVLAGPALNFASGLSGIQRTPKVQRGLKDMGEVKYTKEGAIMQAASGGINVLGTVFFMLFLRAVARCFEDATRAWLANLYLIFVVFVFGLTVLMVFASGGPALPTAHLLELGAAWLACFLGYLFMVANAHIGISRGLARLTVRPEEEV